MFRLQNSGKLERLRINPYICLIEFSSGTEKRVGELLCEDVKETSLLKRTIESSNFSSKVFKIMDLYSSINNPTSLCEVHNIRSISFGAVNQEQRWPVHNLLTLISLNSQLLPQLKEFCFGTIDVGIYPSFEISGLPMLERLIIESLMSGLKLFNLPSLRLLAYSFLKDASQLPFWDSIKDKQLISVEVNSRNCDSLQSFLCIINKVGITDYFKYLTVINISDSCRECEQQKLTQELLNTIFEQQHLFPSLETIFIDPENERGLKLPLFVDPIKVVHSSESNGNDFLSLNFAPNIDMDL